MKLTKRKRSTPPSDPVACCPPESPAALKRLAACHSDGDTDLAWTRITRWRTLLAAALDQAPYEAVSKAVVTGATDSPSTDLLAAWLAWALRCPVQRRRTPAGGGMIASGWTGRPARSSWCARRARWPP